MTEICGRDQVATHERHLSEWDLGALKDNEHVKVEPEQ